MEWSTWTMQLALCLLHYTIATSGKIYLANIIFQNRLRLGAARNRTGASRTLSENFTT